MDFGSTAKSLARNPLGVVALFLVLVEAVAALTLGLRGQAFSEQQRWALIAFLVLFPVVVMGVFAWLVVKHPAKLYAPRDFPNADGFFRGLTVNPAHGTLSPGRDKLTPEIIQGRAYGAEEVLLDGKRFVRCSFHGSTLVFYGTRPVVLEGTSLHGVQWRLDGPAAVTMNFLKGLGASGEPGRRLVENTFDRVLQGEKE